MAFFGPPVGTLAQLGSLAPQQLQQLQQLGLQQGNPAIVQAAQQFLAARGMPVAATSPTLGIGQTGPIAPMQASPVGTMPGAPSQPAPPTGSFGPTQPNVGLSPGYLHQVGQVVGQTAPGLLNGSAQTGQPWQGAINAGSSIGAALQRGLPTQPSPQIGLGPINQAVNQAPPMRSTGTMSMMAARPIAGG